MDKIQKALRKLVHEERNEIKKILVNIKNSQLSGIDIKKLKGRNDVFRIRKGKIRIVYRTDKSNNIFILTIERRNDKTYNF